ncbi:hypothetical protein IAG25_32890 [Caballeronia sp. EK]|uniref:hypothetical protein n=1 Tax=Caballeronia sp. EK TaxID=2767469 RepID=UPI001654D91D|nr:hypothetical protein [Caballeronia sp. EK]MBC8641623.1 hypothetical protein [Caballeronia sp. EK]
MSKRKRLALPGSSPKTTMLTPHSISLSVNIDGDFVSRCDLGSDVDVYVRAMRVVQQRTGMTPRAVLSNHAPVHVRSEIGPLTVGRVSGIPHEQDSARSPVPLGSDEQTLFMRRGDQFVLRTDLGDDYHVAYVALTYDVIPNVVLAGTPIVPSDPLRTPVGDTNALRLLELARERELTATEQFFVALTMPTVWQRFCGQPVTAIVNPTPESARECISFAQHFTAPHARLQQLRELSNAWQSAFFASGEHDCAATAERDPIVAQPTRPLAPVALLPVPTRSVAAAQAHECYQTLS